MQAELKPLVNADWPIAALLALSVGLWVLCDRQLAGGDSEFYPYGVTGVAWYLLGVLLVAWIASRSTVPRAPYRQSLFLLAAFAPLAVVVEWGASIAGNGNLGRPVLGVLLLTGGGLLAWGLRRSTGRGQWPAVLLTLMGGVGVGWVTDALSVQPNVWYAEDAEESPDYQAVWKEGEQLLFEQPGRIDLAVRQMGSRQAGRPNAYFVGFAGYGGQKVFAEEIALAARVIGTKYGSSDRSVRLVNDQRNLNALPLATATGLRRALLEVGRRMDRNEDVLFLVLSSHGSEGAEIAVENGGLPLRQLSGAYLADAIRDAGIRWKVVVISACYAGGFIDALKDDHSIILTAAAADRTSFGCSNDRDLTYFGEAFFRDALPGATSLREAFARAKTYIGNREGIEGVEPSDPQAFYGAALESYMSRLGRGD